jgi:phosphopantothenoylcysteine decarboxylase/phosphopantothenate--cysteine ligase
LDFAPYLEGKNVLLGISGGIAAYKSAHLARLFLRARARVTAMMTPAATRFLGPLTLESLTGRPVLTDVLQPGPDETGSRIEHVAAAAEADLMVIAPATANTLARLAHGLADEMVSTTALACRAPLLLAPAMNVQMWHHPATQANVALLRERGCFFVGPEPGDLACGDEGLGRMSEPEKIVEKSVLVSGTAEWKGRKILVTAGGTREPLDPVRFVGNRSSGKMGCAVARAAAARGAEVILIASGVTNGVPLGVTHVSVQTTAEMREAVLAHCDSAAVVVMAAAVADWRTVAPSAEKWSKETMGQRVQLELVRNPDILQELGERRRAQVRDEKKHLQPGSPLLVGFAAQWGGQAEKRGKAKLAAKGCDIMVINDCAAQDAGFGVETNRAVVLDTDGKRFAFELMSKARLGEQICRIIAARERKRQPPETQVADTDHDGRDTD